MPYDAAVPRALAPTRLVSQPWALLPWPETAYAPFGETYATSGTTDVNSTGINSDVTTNLYDFPAREYGIQGRWPSPDPAGLAAADPSNPQSWNRYAYVTNNPLTEVDPLGLFGNVGPGCFVMYRVPGGPGETICPGGGSGRGPGGSSTDPGCIPSAESIPDRYSDLAAAGFGMPEDADYFAAMIPAQGPCQGGGGGAPHPRSPPLNQGRRNRLAAAHFYQMGKPSVMWFDKRGRNCRTRRIWA